MAELYTGVRYDFIEAIKNNISGNLTETEEKLLQRIEN
jgi:hypothetical protein